MNETSDSNKGKGKNTEAEPQSKSLESQSDENSSASSEPIDTEFEDIEPEIDKTPFEVRETIEKSGPGWGALLTTGAFSSIIGAAIAMVATGSSGVDTAKFAPAEVKNQIVGLENVQTDLNDRVQKIHSSVSEIEARQTSSIAEIQSILEDRLDGENILREELEFLSANLELFSDAETKTVDTPEIITLATDVSDSASSDEEGAASETGDDAKPSPFMLSDLRELIERMETLESQSSSPTPSSTEPTAPSNVALDNDQLVALSGRLDAVEAAEESLRQAMKARSEAIRALTNGLTQTQKAVKSVEGDIEELRSEKVMTDAAAELEKTEVEKSQAAVSNASIAISQVEIKSSRGKPFYGAWTELAKTLPNNANVAALEGIAKRGAPSLEELSNSFSAMEETLTKKASTSQENDGWDWARNALGGVVSVKRTDGENIDNAGRLQNISNALKANKMDDVILNTKSIEGPLALEMKDWLEGAERRLIFDQKMEAVKKDILEKAGVIMTPETVLADDSKAPSQDTSDGNTSEESQ